MVKKSVTSLETKPKTGFACSSTDYFSRMAKNSVTSTKTNGRARILPPGVSRVVLNSLVPARFLNQKETT